MLGLRHKLILGFGGLLAIVMAVGLLSILQLTRLGASIDVILKENYRSVIACQDMNEALERMDSGLLFVLLGLETEGFHLIGTNEKVFEKALQIELNNITVPGEGEKAARLQVLFGTYRARLDTIRNRGVEQRTRQHIYFSELLPLFTEIKNTAHEILRMNQENMSEANERARRTAKSAQERMYLLLAGALVLAVGFLVFSEKWILHPIKRLTRSAEEIKQGNLDLVIESGSMDEIGRLSQTFNEMAANLRQFRRSDRAKLARIERATQQAFNSLPDAMALIDLEGMVEVATETAQDVFDLRPGRPISGHPCGWMTDLYDRAVGSGRPAELAEDRRVQQLFVRGEERFFRPQAVPILDTDGDPTGVILLLQDVTQLRRQDEMKKGLISTASHQLKTPLTSLRMAVHLLLEERVGPLTEKQTELLLTAREDTDRLNGIISDLLDMGRIESGRSPMEFRALSAHTMALEAAESFRRSSEDRGVTLHMDLPPDLPEVWVDPSRIRHVFANLLTNALRYTSPGGSITIAAQTGDEKVLFLVRDTGVGIPEEHLPHVFDPFFRVPEQGAETGVGLGLAIVKEIVEAHNGSVGVESVEGKGSTFTFTLNRADRVATRKGA